MTEQGQYAPEEVDAHGWRPVALGLDLPPASVTGARIGEQRLAIWRNSHGDVRASDDRCPHRGMRLSLGFVRDDMLACLYHGWCFDAEGRCRTIPAHPGLKPAATIRTTTFPTIESDGLIWCRVDGVERPESPPALTSPAHRTTPVRTIRIDAPTRSVSRALGISPDDRTARVNLPLHDIADTPDDNAPTPSDAAAMSAVTVVVVQHAVGREETRLYVLIEGDAPTTTIQRASRWASSLRDKVEREHKDAIVVEHV
ncbi:Rieske 2Fe-2S domain-containing protein [Acetobacter sacchari]|uniref:Rieske 2Fe-2S domain-containing protein n=1 Tax=Acetobacter sacchari TaxID=2661687 RepID=UPI00311CBA15